MARDNRDDDFDDDDDEFDDDELSPEGGFMDALQDQFGSAPWWVISVIFHSIILGLLALILIAMPEKDAHDVIIGQEIPKKPLPEDPPRDRTLFKQEREVPLENETEHPIIVHEEYEITDHMETENEMDKSTAKGQEDAISDIPLGGTGVNAAMGVGGGGAGAFGYRNGGGRKRAAYANGGGRASESAVDAALRWLANHQEAGGRWDGEKHEGKDTDVGITGLALLAFLGAGHTTKSGKYQDNVRRGVRWLIAQQQGNGAIGNGVGIGATKGLGYHHAIAGLALAEAYGMSQEGYIKTAAQKGIDYSINEHQAEYSGWRYNPKDEPDLSVTGWYVMQLKSGKVAQLRVPGQGFQGAIKLLDTVTSGEGDYGSGRYKYQASRRMATHTMTSVGVLCRQFMGWKAGDPEVRGGADWLLEELPSWDTNINFYYWYYGTLVMFQMGNEHWKAWNGAMRDMLIQNQRKGGDEDGSWDPAGMWSSAGGRVYSTAMGALCLEVYYRYLPMYR